MRDLFLLAPSISYVKCQLIENDPLKVLSCFIVFLQKERSQVRHQTRFPIHKTLSSVPDVL